MVEDQDVEMELEVLQVFHPAEDFRSVVRESRKRRAERKSGEKPVEVVTIPVADESVTTTGKRKRQEVPLSDSALQVPMAIEVPEAKRCKEDSAAAGIDDVTPEVMEEPVQGLDSDSVKIKIVSTFSIGTGNNYFISDSTNESVISTNSTTNDSGNMSDFANDSVTSASGDSYSNFVEIDSIMTTSSTDDDGFVLDSARPISTDQNLDNVGSNWNPDEDETREEDQDSVASVGMPNVFSLSTHENFDGDDEEDDMIMPTLLPESTYQSDDYGETDGGNGGQVEDEDEDDVEEIQAGRRREICVVKWRFGSRKKKGGDFLSLEEARFVYNSRPLWCKLCDTFYETIDDLRDHIEKIHRMDGSLVNRFNVATWDLEIARTFEDPLELEYLEDN